MSQAPQLGPLEPPAKKKLFDGITPWQKALAALPLALLFIGGAIGGAVGAAGMVANVKIAKSALPNAVKAVAMLGVTVAVAVVFFVCVGLVRNALNG